MLFSPSWATIKVNILEDLYLALIDFLNTFILSCLLMFIIANDVVIFIYFFFLCSVIHMDIFIPNGLQWFYQLNLTKNISLLHLWSH